MKYKNIRRHLAEAVVQNYQFEWPSLQTAGLDVTVSLGSRSEQRQWHKKSTLRETSQWNQSGSVLGSLVSAKRPVRNPLALS